MLLRGLSTKISDCGLGAAPTVNWPIVEVQTGPTDYAKILELFIDIAYPSVSGGGYVTVGLGRSATTGIGISTGSFDKDDGSGTNSVAGVSIFTCWLSPPTQPADYLRRLSKAGNVTAGRRFAFRFPDGLKMSPSTSISLWLLAFDIVVIPDYPWHFDPTVVLEV